VLAVAGLHAFIGIGWFGAMAYSLFIVQPKVARFFADDEAEEEFVTFLAHGARWKVVGLLAALAGSGGLLVLLAHHRTGWWWAGVGVKTALLTVAAIVFWRVSWRYWPARVFALPAERPAWRQRIRFAGLTLMACAAAASVLGIALHVL